MDGREGKVMNLRNTMEHIRTLVKNEDLNSNNALIWKNRSGRVGQGEVHSFSSKTGCILMAERH